MGFLDFLGKKAACCSCFGGAPSFRCSCHCHRVEDVEYWEPIAYTWICDAETDEDREDAWHRFGQAYPEHVSEEDCGSFWRRIHTTRWHHKHGHECHHHKQEYC